jgi:hypothetical protein
LKDENRLDEAIDALKKAGDLLPASDSRRERYQQRLKKYQHYVTLDTRLPAVPRGSEKPAGAC